jgi:histidine triad (HIT) family protein
MSDCLFCSIVEGTIPAWIVWENDEFLAFLTPYPNVKGFTVVATKRHYSSYVFDLPTNAYEQLMRAARAVGLRLDQALSVTRTALVAEGTGIDHAHVKLIPLHAYDSKSWIPIESREATKFWNEYPGFISTHEGPRMADRDLEEVASQIRNARGN